MIEASNPLRVGWTDEKPTDEDGQLDALGLLDLIFSNPTGLYRPVEAPACGLVEHVDPAVTKDGVPRVFVCDKPAGHDGRHRHIYTDPDELARDGHTSEEAWWTAIEMGGAA